MCYCFGKFEAIFMSETLMEKLAYVGSCPHAGDTRVWANEIQPPQCLPLATQEAIVVTGNDVGQCWTQMIREVSCQLGPMEGQLWTRTSLIIYRPPRGTSLPKKGFCVTGRFFSQFNFIFLLRFFYYTWCFFAFGHRTIRRSNLHRFSQNATYDRRAAEFRGMERTLV